MRCNCHDWLVFRPIINIGEKKRTHRSIVRICLRAKVDGNFNVITIDCGVHGPPRWSNVSHYTAYSWRDRMLNPILRTTTSVQERPALHQYEISDPCDSVSPRAVRPYAYNLHNFNYHNRTSTTAAAAATTSTTLRETVDCTVRDWSIDPLVRVVYRYCRLSRIDRIDIDNVVVSPREPATVSTAKCKEKKKNQNNAPGVIPILEIYRETFFYSSYYPIPCPAPLALLWFSTVIVLRRSAEFRFSSRTNIVMIDFGQTEIQSNCPTVGNYSENNRWKYRLSIDISNSCTRAERF